MNTLLEIRDVKKHFTVKKGFFSQQKQQVKAVDGVSLYVNRGETLGLVGESGCGKSTLGSCIMGLQGVTAGSILYSKGEEKLDVAALTREQAFWYSEQVQIVFQDPYSSLNPQKTILAALDEPMRVHGVKSRAERLDRAARLLAAVNLEPDYLYRYPHEFSGGQRQRTCIARALCVNPAMLVCDEPVSALDVSIQAQVLNLLQDLQQKLGLTYLFIAHDLSVVHHVSDRIAVMYLGRVVELAEATDLYIRPRHPYTQALLSAIPTPDIDDARERIILKGDVPSPMDVPAGCRFHKRCPRCEEICTRQEPELADGQGGAHYTACHFPAYCG